MTFNDFFKARRRVSEVLKHRVLDVSVTYNISIGSVLLLSFFSTRLVLKSWFIKVDVFAHNDALDADENL